MIDGMQRMDSVTVSPKFQVVIPQRVRERMAVKVGDRIGPEKTVCIVEAMKVFNEIPAGLSGQVVAILVENGAPVEFGQPLIKVDPGA